jgi:hypothetical protein
LRIKTKLNLIFTILEGYLSLLPEFDELLWKINLSNYVELTTSEFLIEFYLILIMEYHIIN